MAFPTPDDAGEDLFVHQSGVADDRPLKEGAHRSTLSRATRAPKAERPGVSSPATAKQNEGGAMLAITPGAAEAISGILSASELPEGAALRITSEAAQDESGATRIELRLSLAERPEEGDQVIEGAPVLIGQRPRRSWTTSFWTLTSQATRPSSASATRLRRNK